MFAALARQEIAIKRVILAEDHTRAGVAFWSLLRRLRWNRCPLRSWLGER